jgi:hypothetical protein
VAGGELLVVAVDPDGVHEAVTLATLLPRAPKRHTPVTGTGSS